MHLIKLVLAKLIVIIFLSNSSIVLSHRANGCCSCKSKDTSCCSNFTLLNEKKRKHKKSRRKKKEKKEERKISLMEYDELKKEKDRLIKKGNYEIAIKYIEKMVQKCKDLIELPSLMLELADLMFKIDQIQKAERLYSEFLNLYPGHEKAEYASYRAILCSYWQTNDYYRDQTKTNETIELANKFLTRKEVFAQYADKVSEILDACHEKLLQSEVNIFNFYLNKGDYLAAQTRLKNMEDQFITLIPKQEPVLISLACDLAEKQQNTEMLAKKRADLAARFPGYAEQRAIITASNEKKSFANKF